MERRNLRMLCIDDNPVIEEPPYIDVVELELPDGILPFDRIAGWAQHCSSMAVEKELEFDLLTDDINFARDVSDPQYRVRTRDIIPSGLYHGMMALARRRAQDEVGNFLPLAWEIRSVQPDSFTSSTEVEIEAVRAYGLLRAFLAEPKQDESLIACIVRENLEKRVAPPSEAEREKIEDIAHAGLAGVMLWDLTTQPELTGAGMGVASRLLCIWRSDFLRRLKEQTIHVDVNTLTREKNNIEAKARENPVLSLSEDGDFDPVLPISGWKVSGQYGIRLWSVMADLLVDKQLDVTAKFTNLRDSRNNACSVIDWLKEVLELNGLPGGVKDPIAHYVRLAKSVHVWASSGSKGRAPFWFTSYSGSVYWNQVLVYCIMLTRSWLLSLPVSDATDQMIATELNIPYNENTFRRAFKRTKFGGCRTPSEFRLTLRAALENTGPLFAFVPWLRDVLKEFCRECNVSETTLKQKAPALL
jgi:hypothetical protein